MKSALRVFFVLAAAVAIPACDKEGDTVNITNPPVGGSAAPASGSILYVVQSGLQGILVNVSAADPSRILSAVPLVGFNGGLQGFDYRPADGRLYGIGNDRLHQIDPVSGIVIAVGNSNFNPGTPGNFQGFDFNPVVDRARRVSDGGQNARIDPNLGQIVGGAFDTPLDYPASDPNDPATPYVTGVAYTNSVAGAVTTTLYGIDNNLSILTTINPPNAGQLNTVGPLGVTLAPFSDVGFDITPAGVAYAVMTDNADLLTKLYTINLATGAATLVGRLGAGQSTRCFAVVP